MDKFDSVPLGKMQAAVTVSLLLCVSGSCAWAQVECAQVECAHFNVSYHVVQVKKNDDI